MKLATQPTSESSLERLNIGREDCLGQDFFSQTVNTGKGRLG